MRNWNSSSTLDSVPSTPGMTDDFSIFCSFTWMNVLYGHRLEVTRLFRFGHRSKRNVLMWVYRIFYTNILIAYRLTISCWYEGNIDMWFWYPISKAPYECWLIVIVAYRLTGGGHENAKCMTVSVLVIDRRLTPGISR